jgi:hypothetical protein
MVRAWPLISILCVGFACRSGDPKPSKVAAKAATEEKAEAKADEKKAPKKPAVERISRPDEYFHFTLRGPLFETPQKFEFDPSSVRINVVKSRAAIQYVRKDNVKALSPDGAQVVVNQIQWSSGEPGEYVKDDKRTFNVTLGIEGAHGEPMTLHLEEGKVVVSDTKMRPKELKGTFEGKLERKNKGKEGEVYEVIGAFNLVE